jgi:glycosyltransferase involved in cell wall biosynthesis
MAGATAVDLGRAIAGRGWLLLDVLGAVLAGGIGLVRVCVAGVGARRRVAARGTPRPFQSKQLNLLILGFTPLAAVRAKGNWSDRLCRAYFNPDEFFKRSTVVTFPGKARIAEELPFGVRYEEEPFAWQDSWRFTRGVWAYSRYVIRILARVGTQPVDLIRAQDPHLQGLAGTIVQALAHIPCAVYIGAYWEDIFGEHGELPVFGVRSRGVRRCLSRLVYRHLAGTFSATPADPGFVAAGVPPERIHLMRQEIDLGAFGPWRPDDACVFPEGRLPPRPWILCVGRLHPEKHPADVLHAFRTVARGSPSASLLFCGDGPERANLERSAAELGLASRVVFLGFRPIEQVSRLMGAADVLVCPYSGSVLAEAAASGRAIVAYDWLWHRTLIRHEETGLLTPHRDFDALGEAILRLLRDPALARRLGEAAQAMARQEYSMERIEGLMVEALRKSYEEYHRGRRRKEPGTGAAR